MAIYRTGQASMDAQGYITGYDTKWREQLTLIRPGATIFFIDAPFQAAVISEVISDTQIRAITTGGAEIGRSNYIILLHDSITVDGLAQDVAETLRYYQSKETQIEEAIEFFKNFDLQKLIDLRDETVRNAASAAQSEQNAQSWAGQSFNHAESAKGYMQQTQQIKDSAITEVNSARDQGVLAVNQTKDQAVSEINQIKGDVSNLKNEAISARDSAQQYMTGAQSANSAAETAKHGAETARDEARQLVQQVNPENLLHKDQNLKDLSDKNESRKNLELGVDNSPQFKNIHLYNASDLNSGRLLCTMPNGRTSLYHEIADGVHKTVLETYNQQTESSKSLTYDDHGHLAGVILLTADNITSETVTTDTINCNDTLYGNVIDTTGTILSRAGVYTTGGKPVGVQTPQGAGGNHSIAISTSTSEGDAPVDSWVNYLQGNYYNGNYTFGAVRGGATQIQNVRLFIDSGEGYNSTFEFKPLPANNGYIRSERGFYGRCRPVGWLDTHYADVSPFFATVLESNDSQWMPIVTGASRSTGGYMLRASLGVISQGNSAWPDAVMQLMGDNVVQRTYNFSAVHGDLTTWVGGDVSGKGWTGNYLFQKAATSDRDLKHDIVYTNGKESYDRVMQWLPTLFKYTGSDIQRYGLIAQDLLKIDPEYVKIVPGAPILEPVVQLNEEGEEVTKYIETGRNDDTLALDNNVIMVDMACAMVYMGGMIEKQQKEIDELKAAIAALLNK